MKEIGQLGVQAIVRIELKPETTENGVGCEGVDEIRRMDLFASTLGT